jgi:hypothetical protein
MNPNSMRKILLCFFLFVSFSSHAFALDLDDKIQSRECFRDHLREAISMNRARKPFYDRLSNGASLEISSRLIAGEKLAKFGSYLIYNFDEEAKEFQARGLNIVCDEFVSMSLTPRFRAFSPGPRLANYQPLDTLDIQYDLMHALRDGFPAVRETAIKWINEIKRQDPSSPHPRFHCMVKHVLDSVARIATLAPEHVTRARAMGLRSTASLSRSMISSHFIVLKSSGELDDLAAPLQASGLPILCQDVPPIEF